jgi:uncharacterized protein YjbI with pentapeptide repeats/transcriptional regulator with XRE-family HTH domain
MARSIRVSEEGFKKAKEAFERTGWTQDHLAGRVNCTRQTINKFFAKKNIDKLFFQAICIALNLELEEIAHLESEENELNTSFNTNDRSVQPLQLNTSETSQDHCYNIDATTDPAVVTEEQNQANEERTAFAIAGSIPKVNIQKLKAIVGVLQKITGDISIEIIDIEKGSIKLILEGSQESLEMIETLFKSGELREIEGFLVENVQFTIPKNPKRFILYLYNKYIKLSKRRQLMFTISGSVSLEELQQLKAAFNGTLDNDKELEARKQTLKNTLFAFLRDAVLRNSFLRNALLRNVDLSSIRLRDANLIGANLSGINLSGINLSGINLSGINLSGANLSDINLSGANLTRANLTRANLFGSNLNLADLSSTILSDVNLSGADLSSTILSDVNLSGVNLSGANLSGVNLSGVNLSGANLSGANLSGANLSGVNLSGVNLSGANLSDVNLRSVNLSGVNLSGVNLSGADLSRAILSDASLIRADLSRAILFGANLSGAYLNGANLISAILTDTNLSGADLSGANLSGAYLNGANLSRAYLIGAVVEKAQFGDNLGLTEEIKLDLKQRGAIFEDSSGDRSEVLSRH